MMGSIGLALRALGAGCEGAKAEQQDEAAKQAVDVFARFVEKTPAGEYSGNASQPRALPADVEQPDEAADAPLLSDLSKDLVLAALPQPVEPIDRILTQIVSAVREVQATDVVPDSRALVET